MIHLQIAMLPPSENKIRSMLYAKNRKFYHWYDQQRREWIEYLFYVGKIKKIKTYKKAKLKLIYYFEKERKRDKDNWKKFVLDCLKEAKIIADDSASHIGDPEVEFRIDKNMPRTEIFIWEA